MNKSQELFDNKDVNLSVIEKQSNTEPCKDWYLVTNQSNMAVLLATGLISYPDGIVKSYNDDALKENPGWITLFAEGVPSSEIKRAVNEKSFLLPVALKINISLLSGYIYAVSNTGFVEKIQFPEGFTGNHKILYIPAPLPISAVSDILFPTKDMKIDFIDRAEGTKNVDAQLLSLRVRKIPEIKTEIEHSLDILPVYNENRTLLSHVETVSSMRGLHFLLANKSEEACMFYCHTYIKNNKVEIDYSRLSDILEGVEGWIENMSISENISHSANKKHVALFWEIFNKLAQPDIELDKKSVYDVVISVINKELQSMSDGNWKNALASLVSDLIDLRGMSGKSVDQLFDQYPKPFSRSLIMFFLRDSIKDLFTFNNHKVNVSDYLVASLLFSARENWVKFSKEMRVNACFSKEQSVVMANLYHRVLRTGVKIKEDETSILPLYELLLANTEQTLKATKYREARIMVAKKMKWDCILTTIMLKKGVTYPMNVTTAGVEITFDGEPKSIVTDVKLNEFKVLLYENKLDNSVELEVRKRLS